MFHFWKLPNRVCSHRICHLKRVKIFHMITHIMFSFFSTILYSFFEMIQWFHMIRIAILVFLRLFIFFITLEKFQSTVILLREVWCIQFVETGYCLLIFKNNTIWWNQICAAQSMPFIFNSFYLFIFVEQSFSLFFGNIGFESWLFGPAISEHK